MLSVSTGCIAGAGCFGFGTETLAILLRIANSVPESLPDKTDNHVPPESGWSPGLHHVLRNFLLIPDLLAIHCPAIYRLLGRGMRFATVHCFPGEVTMCRIVCSLQSSRPGMADSGFSTGRAAEKGHCGAFFQAAVPQSSAG